MGRLKLIALSLVALALVVEVLANPFGASAYSVGKKVFCDGGSIAHGTYSQLIVTGTCTLDAGTVSVDGDITLRKGAVLIGAFGGSDLSVGRDIIVMDGATLVLGCLPNSFPCLNDPDQQVGTLHMSAYVGGNITSSKALAVLLHRDYVKGNVTLIGGGGGVNCDNHAELQNNPAYAVVEDSHIAGNLTIAGWQTCWLGVIRNRIKGTVQFYKNITADPDGNEIVTNWINGDLYCWSNSPAPQVGDSQGNLNIVRLRARGQCAGLVP